MLVVPAKQQRKSCKTCTQGTTRASTFFWKNRHKNTHDPRQAVRSPVGRGRLGNERRQGPVLPVDLLPRHPGRGLRGNLRRKKVRQNPQQVVVLKLRRRRRIRDPVQLRRRRRIVLVGSPLDRGRVRRGNCRGPARRRTPRPNAPPLGQSRRRSVEMLVFGGRFCFLVSRIIIIIIKLLHY